MRLLKAVLPDAPVPTRIRRGPFRGATIVMNPRHSLRKVAGLYEHELNGWIERCLPRVSRVIDVGANDGYLTFGCAAAFQRLGVDGEIIGIEAQSQHVAQLRASSARASGARIRIIHALAGATNTGDSITLDSLDVADYSRTLIKIDVEGAEAEVIAGATRWMNPSNYFLIEVHAAPLLTRLLDTFAARGLTLDRVDQQPLWWLGREQRDADNWWLLSRLDAA